MIYHRLFAVLAVVGCAADPQPLGDLPTYEAWAAEEVLAEEVVGVDHVVQLSTGVLAFVEPWDYHLTLVDPVTHSVQRLGRQGGGAGEFTAFPEPLARLSGDTLLVIERLPRRFTLYRGSELIRAGHLPGLPPGLSWLDAKVRGDRNGNLYVIFSSVARPVLGKAYTLPILRTRIEPPRFDTVSWLDVPPVYDFPIKGKVDAGVIGPLELSPTNTADVSRDGNIWLVYPGRQQVLVVSAAGDTTEGPPWGLTEIPVSQADRDSVFHRWEHHPGYGGAQWEFADMRAVTTHSIVNPAGEVWLRLDAARRGETAYLVINEQGVPYRRVLFRGGTEVVGFGDQDVYSIREDEDGIATLYRAPLDTTGQ